MKVLRVERDRFFNESTREEELAGKTKEECFKEFYNRNKVYRYCNDVFYKFKDEEDKLQYDSWYKSLSEAQRFNMYYGNSIVD